MASSEPSSHEPRHVPSGARLTLNGSWCCTTSNRAEGPPSAAATAEAELSGDPEVAGAAAGIAAGLEQLATEVSCPGEERQCELSSEGCSITLGNGSDFTAGTVAGTRTVNITDNNDTLIATAANLHEVAVTDSATGNLTVTALGNAEFDGSNINIAGNFVI